MNKMASVNVFFLALLLLSLPFSICFMFLCVFWLNAFSYFLFFLNSTVVHCHIQVHKLYSSMFSCTFFHLSFSLLKPPSVLQCFFISFISAVSFSLHSRSLVCLKISIRKKNAETYNKWKKTFHKIDFLLFSLRFHSFEQNPRDSFDAKKVAKKATLASMDDEV